MDYYKINYKKLENMHQIKYSIFILIITLVIIILIILSYFNYTYDTEIFYGIYNDNILRFNINAKLSDIFKKQNIISFNGNEFDYKILGFSNHEIINNEVYETIELEVDGNFYQNEAGEIKVYFDKKKIIFYILDLFK